MLHMTPDKSCQRASGAGVVHSGQLPTLSRGQQRDRQTTNHTYEQFVPRLWEEIIHRDTGNMQNPRTKVASQMVDLIPGPSHCEATVLTHWNLKKINKFKKKSHMHLPIEQKAKSEIFLLRILVTCEAPLSRKAGELFSLKEPWLGITIGDQPFSVQRFPTVDLHLR